MKLSKILFLLIALPFFLIGGEKQLSLKNVYKVTINAGTGYFRFTTNRHKHPIEMEYTFPEKNVSYVYNYEDDHKTDMEISFGKLKVSSDDDDININISKNGPLSDSAYVNLYPNKPIDFKLNTGASRCNIDIGDINLRSIDINSGASNIDINFENVRKLSLDYLNISSGASKIKANNLLNCGADSINISGGVNKLFLDFTGKLKKNMYVKILSGVGLTNIGIDKNISCIMVISKGFLASNDISEYFEKVDDSTYVSPSYRGNKKHLNIHIENSLGCVNIYEK